MPGAPPKHPAVMALTRSMMARLQAQALATETFSTPVKIPRTTSSPRTTASSLSPFPLLDFQEPEAAWKNFKNILFQKLDINVPKFTIKSEYQPPWFDSECYLKCKEKDKLHKTYKKKKTVASEIKFKAARRNFKSLIKSKMRANLDIENRNIRTKKFWSYLKSTTKSTRIPEVVSNGTIVASEPIAKAKLFSKHFRKQFSESSSYEVELDFQHDSNFKIDFSVSRIKSILDALDTNKANGPDDISGSVLKNCSDSLSYPLSKIFHLSYNVGYIPSEWKT